MEKRQISDSRSSDSLLGDIRVLLEILNPLIGSYRLLVGAAEEFNGITLAHKSDLEAAIKRADDMGDIIDDIDKKLKNLIKELIKTIDCSDDYIVNMESNFHQKESSDDSLPL